MLPPNALALLLVEQLAQQSLELREAQLEKLILQAVQDAPRPGAPLTYTAEQQCGVIALAVRKPSEFNLPIEMWTSRELAQIANRERIAPGISSRTVRPLRCGSPALLEFEYRRHGTQTLIPTFEVATGRILVAHVGPTRTEADFAHVVKATVQTDPSAGWVFIADQLNTHKSETLVRFIAAHIGFDGQLGRKEHHGILKNLASRESFLTDSAHRIRFVYTPKHCSWLNQIEIWFSILSRKALKHASFASLDELRDRILRFVEHFNRTMAKAFKWTYRGKALHA